MIDIRTKTSSQRMLRNRRDTSEPLGNLLYQVKKRIHNIFQIRGDKTQRRQLSLKTK